MKDPWPSHWQRLGLVALALLNLGESYVLFRRGSYLALLNVAIALICLVFLVPARRKRWPDQR